MRHAAMAWAMVALVVLGACSDPTAPEVEACIPGTRVDSVQVMQFTMVQDSTGAIYEVGELVWIPVLCDTPLQVGR